MTNVNRFPGHALKRCVIEEQRQRVEFWDACILFIILKCAKSQTQYYAHLQTHEIYLRHSQSFGKQRIIRGTFLHPSWNMCHVINQNKREMLMAGALWRWCISYVLAFQAVFKRPGHCSHSFRLCLWATLIRNGNTVEHAIINTKQQNTNYKSLFISKPPSAQ